MSEHTGNDVLHSLRKTLQVADDPGDRVIHGSGENDLTQVDPHHSRWAYNDGSLRPESVARVYAYDPYKDNGLGIVAAVFRGVIQAGKKQFTQRQLTARLLDSRFAFDLDAGQVVCHVNHIGWDRLQNLQPIAQLYGLKPPGFEPTTHPSIDPPGLTCKLSSINSAEVMSGPASVDLYTIAALGNLITIEPVPLPDLIAMMPDPARG